MNVACSGNSGLTVDQLRHIVVYTRMAPHAVTKSAKRDRLRQLGVLNPHPEAVQAPWFAGAGFFDPEDLVQVKYEMLRHVRKGGATKAQAAELFGLSRPTYYQAEAAFERDGLFGLLPKSRGPRSAHKLTEEVMQLLHEQQRAGITGARSLALLAQQRLGLQVHPRSIERAMSRQKKR